MGWRESSRFLIESAFCTCQALTTCGKPGDVLRLLDRLRRESGRDPQVMQALAEALMEAGIDLNALAGRAGAAAGPAAAGLPLGAAPAAAAPGKLWTPGGEQPGAGGEKKAIWTPG